MKSLFHIFSILVTLFLSVRGDSSLSADSANVIELTDGNFEHLTQASTGQTTGKWFVFFSSPRCPHCTSLHPKWRTLAEELSTEHSDSSVLIASVDITKSPELAQRFNIKSMPTLYFFADRGMYEYEPRATRDVDSFIAYVLAGYKAKEKMEVPAKPTLLQVISNLRKHVHGVEFLNAILNDFEEILSKRKNAAVLIFMAGVVAGIFLCLIQDLLNSRRSKKQKRD